MDYKIAAEYRDVALRPEHLAASRQTSRKIDVAVAERLAHLEHDEWLQNRKLPSRAKTLEAISVLDELGSDVPDKGDELPGDYLPKNRAVSRRKKQRA